MAATEGVPESAGLADPVAVEAMHEDEVEMREELFAILYDHESTEGRWASHGTRGRRKKADLVRACTCVRATRVLVCKRAACFVRTIRTVQPVRKSQLTESIQSYTRALIGTDSMTSSTGTIWNSAWSAKVADASNAAAALSTSAMNIPPMPSAVVQ